MKREVAHGKRRGRQQLVEAIHNRIPSLEDELDNIDGSFQETLFKHIIRKGYTDAEAYKKANIDRRHFAKIRKDKYYHPSKNTVLAFCIALKLTIKETRDLLSRAGYSFSPAIPFDIVVKYYIDHNIYNVFEINEALFSFDQELLGQ